jgi:pilus assembly protein Flp/PilA
MKSAIRKRLYILVTVLSRAEGQDLVEYALVIALIAFGAAAGMNSVATGLNTAFSNIGSYLVTITS